MTFKLRLPLAFMAGLFLSGCAITDEFSRQGGFTDRILDGVLFSADEKEHRVFRSYLLVGILARIGSESPVNIDDREAIGFRIAQAVQASREALICARDSNCAFFEDRQAILDRRLFRLAVAVLYPEETRDLLSKVGKSLQGKLPVAGRALQAASAAVELVGEAGGTVNEAAGIVNSLLDLGFVAFQYSQRLGPLYRDSIDLDMSILKEALIARLEDGGWSCNKDGEAKSIGMPVDEESALTVEEAKNICSVSKRATSLHNNGVGSIREWRGFLSETAKALLAYMKPQDRHWAQASDLISRGCMLLLKEKKVEVCRPKNSLIHERELRHMLKRQKEIDKELN
ncbi:hypothetical protein B6S44_20740 [Bosea sp. Tri-44]|uniref:hypothetical protein n=1 Tax=Bosea sp. Tri-44 TaxID=1972137 RepID=UPI00100DF69B|nr:hypothetical protein [Bosea sp. Tri-44]RXT53155.1 hypothetical protein B6S44_20740 [Bosea sp. Tri-44]